MTLITLAAIITGHFELWNATKTFALVALLAIAIGVAIGFIVYTIHRYFPTTPSIDAGISGIPGQDVD